MKKQLPLVPLALCFMMIFVTLGSSFSPSSIPSSIPQSIQRNRDFTGEIMHYDESDIPVASDIDNEAILEEILQDKRDQFTATSRFSQYWESSLRATYYALYIFSALEKLEELDLEAITNYLMSNYDSQTGIFTDDLARRSLDRYDDGSRYVYASWLESHCYAILSLILMNDIGSININLAEEFIWSCYNPDKGGFIGRPYSASLHPYLLEPTIDNTYYAVLTLDKLMNKDWTGYSDERNAIATFMGECQDLDPTWGTGGYTNVEDPSGTLFSTNVGKKTYHADLLTSYQAIWTLETLGYFNTISEADLEDFLELIYQGEPDYYFKFSHDYFQRITGYGNLIGTALGIAVHDKMAFNAYPVSSLISTVMENINPATKLWGDTLNGEGYEALVDTFIVIRALNDTNNLGELTTGDKTTMASSILDQYHHYGNGFTLESRYLTSLDTARSIISAFYNEDVLGDLNINELYDDILAAHDEYYHECFFSNLFVDSSLIRELWSAPTEWSTLGTKTVHDQVNSDSYDQESTFKALDSLKTLCRLNNYHSVHSLDSLLDVIAGCQFINESYSTSGGFTSFNNPNQVDYYKNRYVSLSNTFHAIKSMELICNYLNINPFTDAILNKEALIEYLNGFIQETSQQAHAIPEHSTKSVEMMEATYQAIYILKKIGATTPTTIKLINYLNNNIDYSNIKSVYFAWKLSILLDESADIDIDKTQCLIDEIYDPELKEFYLTTTRKRICQEALGWIAEMDKNDSPRAKVDYEKDLMLGSNTYLRAWIGKIVSNEVPETLEVWCESDQLGVFALQKQSNNLFETYLTIPATAVYYPQVSCHIKVREGEEFLFSKEISINTYRELIHEGSVSVDNNQNAYAFINVTSMLATGNASIPNPSVYCVILADGAHFNTSVLAHKPCGAHDFFNATFPINRSIAVYEYQFYLNDDLQSNVLLFSDYIATKEIPADNDDEAQQEDQHDDWLGDLDNYNLTSAQFWSSVPLAIAFTVIPGISLSYSILERKKAKNEIALESLKKARAPKTLNPRKPARTPKH